MPVIKSPKDRIKIIDEIFRGVNRYDFDALLNKVNEILSRNGTSSIGEKTLYNDLKYLREELGAPINKPSRLDNRYYYTEEFSITDPILDFEEIEYLKQLSLIIKKLIPEISENEFDEIIAKVDNRFFTSLSEDSSIVDIENHTHASGIHWYSSIFTAIKEKSPLRITYKPFFEIEAREFVFHPYLLKQYRNRWYVFGREEENTFIDNLGLDRILFIKNSNSDYIGNDIFSPDDFFNHLIGVSKPRDGEIRNIILRVASKSVPYVLSKPIQKNQEIIENYPNGDILIKVPLYINYELISTILGFQNGLEVIEPIDLRNEIVQVHKMALLQYEK